MVSRLAVALSTAVLAVGLAASPAHAQMRITFTQGRGAGPGRGVGPAGGRGIPRRPVQGFGREREEQRGYGGYVVLPPYYYPYEGGYPQQAPPAPPAEQPPVQQAVAQPAPAPVPPSPPVESLLLEFHKGQWIRVPMGSQIPNGPLANQPESTAQPSPTPAATSATAPAQNQPPAPHAVLVFRDGHREEITQYVIHGGYIDVSEDYWSTGSWMKRIPISELDVPATLRLNQQRGVKFSLPSGPDEVVLGF